MRFQRVVADGIARKQGWYELVNGEFVEGVHLRRSQGVADNSVESHHRYMFTLGGATITVWR